MRLLLFSFLITSTILAEDACLTRSISAIPEWYHVRRTKKGGSKQTGNLYGVQIKYERKKPCGFYLGIEYEYAKGRLSGKTKNEVKLVSDKIDRDIEGLLGFTLTKWISITPYAGVGYFRGNNNFRDPSPIPCHFRNKFYYWSWGFILDKCFCKYWNVGVNLRVKHPHNPKSRVSNDPEYQDMNLSIGEKNHYLLELPISFQYMCLGASLVPFFRQRKYGGNENYPFDFIETTYRNLGIRLKISLIY